MTKPKTRIQLAYDALETAHNTTDHQEAFREIKIAASQLYSQSYFEPRPPRLPSNVFMDACNYLMYVLTTRLQLQQDEDLFRARDFLRAKINVPSKTR